ncbi:hypothetical protein ACFP9V_23225 [Deinococcus radiopugnans]|uniref:DUF4292 domain-containing protein n=1 Tax=Deinococcus radiopugnans ATCC 19172 TaxID=585398 RepID=A0A5C4Y5D9_9DEIO|nr:hypothetical protein [Deinococcus radiopugnans]MBB6017161.1 hypothetical protein [Deinococcus radiopugnans ATCC 19172]TNM70618.1 hypothetical protein FHR04_11985 [Deinococcus radiopugnans ATCC 19172]
MKMLTRQWLSAATLSALLLSGAVQAGGAGAPPVARPAVPAVQPAQTQAQAGRVLLDKALKANGGEALRGLRTTQQRSEMTFVDAQGQPVLVLPITASVDYVNGWARLTTSQGGQVINEQFLTSQGAFVSTPQSGTVPLPRQEAKSLTDSFFYGAPGLRQGNQGRESVKNLGEQTWLKVEGREIKGTVLEVVTKGVKATYLLNSQGLIVAERYPIEGLGEVISVYGNFQAIGGMQVPGMTLGFAPNGTLLYVIKDLETRINVTLPADTFKVPE